MVLRAAIFLTCSACAPTPWLTRSIGCTVPPVEDHGLQLEYCSDDALPFQRCLYVGGRQCGGADGEASGTYVTCSIERERSTCNGPWVLNADTCGIVNEPPSGGEIMVAR